MTRVPVVILAVIGILTKPMISAENVLADETDPQNPEVKQDPNADDQSRLAERDGQQPLSLLRRQQLWYYKQTGPLLSQGYLQQQPLVSQQGPVYDQQDQHLRERPANNNNRPVVTQCYSCSDCPETKFNTTIRYCPTDLTNPLQSCVKFTEQYGKGGRKIVIRGCSTELGTCGDIKKQHEKIPYVNLMTCDECDHEACNGAFRSITNHIMMFTTIIIMPVMFKNIL